MSALRIESDESNIARTNVDSIINKISQLEPSVHLHDSKKKRKKKTTKIISLFVLSFSDVLAYISNRAQRKTYLSESNNDCANMTLSLY